MSYDAVIHQSRARFESTGEHLPMKTGHSPLGPLTSLQRSFPLALHMAQMADEPDNSIIRATTGPMEVRTPIPPSAPPPPGVTGSPRPRQVLPERYPAGHTRRCRINSHSEQPPGKRDYIFSLILQNRWCMRGLRVIKRTVNARRAIKLKGRLSSLQPAD